MNRLKTGKGALKDYHRCLADECDDYAEEPEETDPISHLNKYHARDIIQKTKPLTIKHTSKWPKYKSDFNLEVYSQGVLDGAFGEKVARYLKISDLARLLSTCRYFSRVFIKTSMWASQMIKTTGNFYMPDNALSSINAQQFFKYLYCKRGYGVVFDTVSLERDMEDEDKLLTRNLVDFVKIKSQKTVEMMSTLTQKAVLTGDLKISWVKETNQVSVWVTDYHTHSNNLHPFSCILFQKKYEEGLIQKAYFLNDGYFVIEMEEKDGAKSLEVFVIEAEAECYEKTRTASFKQILKENLTEKTENVKVKNVGDFFVFVFEREEKILCFKVFDANGKCLFKSEDLEQLDAGFSDIISSKSVTENSLNLYLLDKESNVYLVDYSLESGMNFQKMSQEMQLFNVKEISIEKQQQNQRFGDTVKKYHSGRFKGQSQTIEYLMVYQEKKFYFMKFETNQLIHCDLPESDLDLRLFSWTVSEDYLFLLIENTIQIYKLDFNKYSAVFHKIDTIEKSKFEGSGGSGARWILVNPCVTIVTSTGSLGEHGMSDVRILIGSTQKLLLSRQVSQFEGVPDECYLYNMLGHVEKWEDISVVGQEKMECKFEDERLLIRTNLRTYFRDFNVCEERLNRNQYGWKLNAKYDLVMLPILSTEEKDSKQGKTKKKNNIPNLLGHENKNYDGKMKKSEDQNWKNIEKKPENEEKIEKKENRKKGDKYYKNIRQSKHREKMSD